LKILIMPIVIFFFFIIHATFILSYFFVLETTVFTTSFSQSQYDFVINIIGLQEFILHLNTSKVI
jgi:hypothetical protein